jgi:hypothetical protein
VIRDGFGDPVILVLVKAILLLDEVILPPPESEGLSIVVRFVDSVVTISDDFQAEDTREPYIHADSTVRM